MAYSDKVIDHYENPRNVGSFDKADPDVGTGMVGAPACGDVMKLQIKVNPDTGVIEDARFKMPAVQKKADANARTPKGWSGLIAGNGPELVLMLVVVLVGW